MASAATAVETFDYVVVGAGTAGCVVAGRLSEDADQSVCLLEAGGSDQNIIIRMPLAAPATFRMVGWFNWDYYTTPQPGLNGRRGYQPRGKVLGGSSSINAMVYTRGNPRDYDHWASLGNVGWSWQDCLPVFKRCENNHCFGETDLRGQGGPLQVSFLRSPSPLNQVFQAACVSQGLPYNPDYNGVQQYGISNSQVTQFQGERWNAARAYLDPARSRSNLKIQTRCLAAQVLFEGKRAVGVVYHQRGQRKIVRARKEVILSGGAFGSPQLLKLSGVGPRAELERLGIPVVHELPGVGENLQDHLTTVLTYFSPKKDDVLGFSPKGLWNSFVGVLQWLFLRKGPLAGNIAETQGFFSTEGRHEHPDIQLAICAGIVDDHRPNLRHGYSLHVTLMHPESRGRVTLASADPKDAPLIDMNYLADRRDLDRLKKAVRYAHQILEAPALAAHRNGMLNPLDPNDDQALEAFVRNCSDTEYHPVGTCKMGPASDPMAVVDPELRVHGLTGLRVIDAAIMPTVVTGNTNAPTYMIGEQGAAFIRRAAGSARPGSH